MLPYPNDLMKMAGLDPAAVLASMQGDGRGVNAKTIRYWIERKTEPRESAVRRFLENVISRFVGTRGAKVEARELMRVANKAAEQEENLYLLAWGQLFCGIEQGSQSKPWLVLEEAKRLVELTRSAQVHMKDHDHQGLAQFLAQSDIPKTNVTLEAIEALRQSNQFIDELLQKALSQVTLTNLLYLIACADAENELLLRLSPIFEDDDIKLPMSRWLDAIKEGLSFSSDRELGRFLLPNYDPENAKREVMRWRKGKLPPWKTVMKFPRKDEVQLFTAFACIRILHGICSELNGPSGADIGLDFRSLFETSPQLQKLACERQKLLSAKF